MLTKENLLVKYLQDAQLQIKTNMILTYRKMITGESHLVKYHQENLFRMRMALILLMKKSLLIMEIGHEQK